ncbi:hypothetical protein BX616_000040 [Lobosporangium transversale]|nr:hypothetical protein BX616_000040 [Lobosporangium transversale]
MIASRFIRLAAPVSRAVAARPAAFMAVRSFTSPSAPSQDILKDLYIKELKGYKPAPEAPAVDASADLAAWETANAEIADAVSEEAVEEAEEEEVEEEEEEHHH